MKLLDIATFLEKEYFQKCAEYGTTWRTAFKKELHEIVGNVIARLMPPEQDQENTPAAA